ncbi:transmembrane emp24 domain-containing protein 1-like [Pieris napi]|uniref:transmembrane emp24 domain-containing protein 1-like n=1 Tax=Pieris napi TaxID=78633 RepID=UPI001FB9FD5E|nr:transmembrane emp24 domain-containing protein 1-like [Pieris napi]
MYLLPIGVIICHFYFIKTQEIFESDVNMRVDAGTRTCIFEKGKSGQIMEFFYQVLDGQHGDLDISVDVFSPNGDKIISDHKKSQNSIIMDLEHEGDYIFCLDNTHSLMNSKLVFVYVVIEEKNKKEDSDVSVIGEDEEEHKDEAIVEWFGVDENDETYVIPVSVIIDSVARTLNYVIRARHMLDIYSATKTRDGYLALEDTFIVDVWSACQITLMIFVGTLQVYMIKNLFNGHSRI